jgi:predicted ATPase/class 3 adenylate cyclase/DNA-binding CsgD family transcriptional regulator
VTGSETPGRLGPLLPVGTVTFLLTDVEGSTRQWETDPSATAAAIARHYEILDEAIEAHNGVRPVEQGEGDSVVGAFALPSDALAAACQAQLHLQTEDWPESARVAVRMAIHTGEAELRDERNYFGTTIIRCARLRAIGVGGQVLVSGSTADLVSGRLPADATLADLGLHRLKDLGRPERVFELRHPGIPAGKARLSSLDNLPNNLPVQLTSFVGRAVELSNLRRLLPSTRLLSITGAGGCGKTRLALQLAADMLDGYEGGAWLVELATLSDPERVTAMIASVLGERELSGDLIEAVAIRVSSRPTLVVLDNCEHLLDAVAKVADALLRRCESLTLVVTSREPLGVPGETAWRVPSMAAPGPSDAESVDTLAHFDAVQLFVDRAAKARPNFALTTDNAAGVAQICRRLEGIPLAVELAAARVRGLPVEQIAAGLDDRFRLLTGGARTVMPRQQTLQASVDWSYDLLSEPERAVFRRLSVFAGGFTLDAAEHVAAGGDIAPVEVLDLLVALVDKSMIDTDEPRSRYHMLESLRQYGAARLLDSGETTEARDAHLGWAAGSVDPIDVIASDVADQEARFRDEIDNFRAAFEWAVATGDADGAIRCLAPLGRWEVSRGDPRAGIEVALRALEMRGASHRLRCHARASLAYAYAETGDADQVGREVDVLLDELDGLDDVDRAVCLLAAAAALQFSPAVPRGIPLLEDALASAQRAERADLERTACMLLAGSHFICGHWEAGEAYAAQVPRDPGSNAAVSLSYIQEYAAWVRGRLDEAQAILDELPTISNPRMEASVELMHMQLDIARGTDSGAAARLGALLERARRRGFTSAIGQLGWGPGIWRMLHGEPEAGAQEVIDWLSETQAAWGSFAYVGWLTLGRLEEARARIDSGADAFGGAEAGAIRATADTILTRLEGDPFAAEQIGHDALVAHHRAGFRREVVHTLEALAGLASEQGSHVECARLAGAAQALRGEMGYVLRWPYEDRLREADLAAARAAIGDDAFEAAFADGATLDEEGAVAYAQRARGERKRPTTGWDSLTPTELEVVRLVASGLTNKDVGRELLMGAETVKTHLAHVYDKVGLRSRTALATEFASRS